MLRSMYIASTGMLAQRQKMDVMTNNITNIETIGYKKDTILTRSFKDMLIERANDLSTIGKTNVVGPQNTGLHVDEIVTCFDQGGVEETGRLFDIALEGEGFFCVQTEQGERYTRAGSFAVDNNGYLVNSDGYYVSGQNGRIYVGQNEISVDESGGVYTNGTPIDMLKIVSFSDYTALRKQGNNLYVNQGNAAVVPAGSTIVKQGSIENSNVNMAQEIVDIMAVSRTYETNQRVVKMLDQSLEKTVNEVGRV